MNAEDAFKLLMSADFWLSYVIMMLGLVGHFGKKLYHIWANTGEFEPLAYWTSHAPSSAKSILTAHGAFLGLIFTMPDQASAVALVGIGYMADSIANKRK